MMNMEDGSSREKVFLLILNIALLLTFCSHFVVVLGAPQGAAKVSYQKHYARKLFVPLYSTLEETLKGAVSLIGDGAVREGNEVKVPYLIWRTREFQHWYTAQKSVDNRVDDVR